MKTFIEQAAQGDILITKIDSIPDTATKVATEEEFIVAHSETGHHHVVQTAGVDVFEAANDPFVLYLAVSNPTVLRHKRNFDTHAPIEISPGLYRINRQREYIPEGFRKAAD